MDFASFLREKQYLENVSANTLRWYRHALKWLPTENPDELALKDYGYPHERGRVEGNRLQCCHPSYQLLPAGGAAHRIRFGSSPPNKSSG